MALLFRTSVCRHSQLVPLASGGFPMGLITFALQSPTSAIAQVLGEVVKLAENYCV